MARYNPKFARDENNNTLDYNGKKFKSGRKPKHLDPKTLEKLGKEGLTITRVADYFGVVREVIYKEEHLVPYKRGLAWLAHQISFIQVQKAMNGSDHWLRILGEQLLEQSETIKIEQTVKNETLGLTPEQINSELKQIKKEVRH